MLNPRETWAHPVCTVGCIICPTLQMRKWRLRETWSRTPRPGGQRLTHPLWQGDGNPRGDGGLSGGHSGEGVHIAQPRAGLCELGSPASLLVLGSCSVTVGQKRRQNTGNQKASYSQKASP